MWKDPIVEEVRAAGRQLEAQANGDLHQYFERLRVAQRRYAERVIDTPSGGLPRSGDVDAALRNSTPEPHSGTQ